jgi:spore coat polysaccharide biosynthesis protein SpsF (cytidylyltransferase family)
LIQGIGIELNNLAILQARMASTRLPGKVLLEINGIPSIKFQIDRIRNSKIDDLVVATSTDSSDDILVAYLNTINVEVRRGPLEDVATRFHQILDEYDPKCFLRLTADCPFVMPKLIDQMLDYFQSRDLDYLSNTTPPTFPDGLDIEVVKTSAFMRLVGSNLTDLEREHVTLGFNVGNHEFSRDNFGNHSDLSYLRWTVDYPGDLEYLRKIASFLVGREELFRFEDILQILENHPGIVNARGSNFRNIALRADYQE